MASAIGGWAGYSSEITSIIITSIIRKITLVSLVHIKNDGNNTPFFLIPVALMIASTYFIFPLGMFTIQIITAFASFSLHVCLDKQYHIAGSLLLRFAWFRRKQQLHFVHHTHGNSNFAIIDNFWDRLLGTYRDFDADDAENPHRMAGSDGQAK
jgi:sterol desaturase/sphingolipid hydroxylase (fatty acid hydroxylase superfamily)